VVGETQDRSQGRTPLGPSPTVNSVSSQRNESKMKRRVKPELLEKRIVHALVSEIQPSTIIGLIRSEVVPDYEEKDAAEMLLLFERLEALLDICDYQAQNVRKPHMDEGLAA